MMSCVLCTNSQKLRKHQFSDRELGAWLSLLRATGCSNITPWSNNDSEVLLNPQNPIQDKPIFTTLYQMELQDNLGVGSHIISESKKHAILNGFGAPPIKKPKFSHLKFSIEQIDQFNSFFMRKDEKFAEKYPNGIHRTAFMTRLQGSRFVYKDDLGGLCLECNECRYEIFAAINTIITAHIKDESLKDCKELFHFFDLIKNNVNEELRESLDDYLKKLISWIGHHARKFYLNTHVQVNLDELDEDGAIIIVNYKMRILPQNARETKSQFFGKRGWTLHSSLVYTKDTTNNKLNIQPKPKWVTIMSDNRPHYHCTELMLVIGHWKDWYDIVSRKWIFLEASEAKTLIDSHHAQVKLGSKIESGNDIEEAIHGIAGTKVANLLPNRDQEKVKIGTIAGIKSFHEWTWADQEEDVGFIYDSPTSSELEELDINLLTSSMNNINTSAMESSEIQSHNVFVSEWTLKFNKNNKWEPWKRISKNVKHLLENMFHTGTANPNNKFSA
ncbi:hypothetical protein C1646_773743 [Rhizophagus diaphanus]|nr:hypothetical protein C1646_773743 [Rhizophagus diaphanus] [Rhizophagus sp. MUCL 43196]